MKGPADKPVAKRRKVHMKTKVLTDEEYLAELKRLEEEDAAKKARKEAVALKKKKTASKKIDFGRSKRKNACDDDDDDDNDVDEDEDDEIDEETEEEVLEGSEDDDEEDDEEDDGEDDEEDDEDGLIKLWKSIAPPTNESDLLGKWFGVIYYQSKKTYLYVGKVAQRFLFDEGGPVAALRVDCLKPQVGLEPVLESIPPHLPRDMYTCPVHNIIGGPLVVEPLKGDKWRFPHYDKLKEKYKRVAKIDREKLSQKLL